MKKGREKIFSAIIKTMFTCVCDKGWKKIGKKYKLFFKSGSDCSLGAFFPSVLFALCIVSFYSFLFPTNVIMMFV